MKHIKLFEQFINEKKELYTAYIEDDREPGGTDKEIKKDYNLTVANRTKYGFDVIGAKQDVEDFIEDYGIIGDVTVYEGQLNEYSSENFKSHEIKSKDAIKARIFAKLMPRTAKTAEEAADKIKSFDGTAMATHVQYFVVRPNGNKPDRPTYRIHEEQYYKWRPNDPKVDVSKLYILELKEGGDWNANGRTEENWNILGSTYVKTSQWLEELNIVFETIRRAS